MVEVLIKSCQNKWVILGEELIEKQRHWVITWVYNALSKMA
jgi:hypothetical protein